MSGWRVIISKHLDPDIGNCVVRMRQQDQDAARLVAEYLYATVIRIVRHYRPGRAPEKNL